MVGRFGIQYEFGCQHLDETAELEASGSQEFRLLRREIEKDDTVGGYLIEPHLGVLVSVEPARGRRFYFILLSLFLVVIAFIFTYSIRSSLLYY